MLYSCSFSLGLNILKSLSGLDESINLHSVVKVLCEFITIYFSDLVLPITQLNSSSFSSKTKISLLLDSKLCL